MGLKPTISLTLIQVTARIVPLLLFLLVVFSAYKFIVLSGYAVVLIIVIASVLVAVIAYCLKEAGEKLIITGLSGVPIISQNELSVWVEKRYRLMSIFLWCGLFGALCLFFLGSMAMVLIIPRKQKDFIDVILGIFGFIIFSLGIYFAIVLANELKFVVKQKSEIISRILDQIHNFITNPP